MGWLRRKEELSLSMTPDGKISNTVHLISTDFTAGHTANLRVSSGPHQCPNADLHQDTRCYHVHTTLAIS